MGQDEARQLIELIDCKRVELQRTAQPLREAWAAVDYKTPTREYYRLSAHDDREMVLGAILQRVRSLRRLSPEDGVSFESMVQSIELV